MDPVSAVGVAAAVVQFIDFSLKVLKIFSEIRDDEQDATRSNKEFEQVARTLEHYRSQLSSTTRSRQTDRRIIAVAHECARTAKELLDLLEYVRGGDKKIGKAKATWRALLKRKPINDLRRLLENREAVLDKLLIQDTNVNVERLRKEIQEQNLSSTESIQRLSKALQKDTLKELNLAKESLHRRFDVAELEAQRYRDIASHLGDRERFLQSLFFPELDQRRSSIRGAHPGTFHWIYDNNETLQDTLPEVENSANPGDDEDKAPSFTPRSKQSDGDSDSDAGDLPARSERPRWDNFARWLREEDSVFWISGKAGSGKSTLMAYIVEHHRTEGELRTWSQSAELLTLSFFFWRAGSSLQQSVIGLLRGLLYQLCRARPQIIPDLLSLMKCSVAMLPAWTEDRLRRLIKTAIASAAEYRICIFIDGLDEFTGPYDELTDLMFELQALDNVKCCVSSRPEIELTHALASCHRLRLQDLNEQDIKTFVRDKLRPLGLARSDLKQLTWNVTHRSEGIFLWAALVTQSLVKGVKSGDEFETLELRLDQIPQDLDKLFLQMFQKIDKVHRKSLAFYFQVARLGQEQDDYVFRLNSIANIAAARYLSQVDTYERFAQRCEQLETQVVAQSAGILEVVSQGIFYGTGGPFIREAWEEARSIYMVPELRYGNTDKTPGNFRRREIFKHPVPYPEVMRYEGRYIAWIHRSAFEFLFPADGEPSQFDFGGQDLRMTLCQIGKGAAKYVAVAPSFQTYKKSTAYYKGASEVRISRIIVGLLEFKPKYLTTVSSILDILYQSVLKLSPSEISWDVYPAAVLDPDDGLPPMTSIFWKDCIAKHPEYLISRFQLMTADLKTTSILAANLQYFTNINPQFLWHWQDFTYSHGQTLSLIHMLQAVLERIGVNNISEGKPVRQRKLYIDRQYLLSASRLQNAVFLVSCLPINMLRGCEEKYNALVHLCLANTFMKWKAPISTSGGGHAGLLQKLEGKFRESFCTYDKLITRVMEDMEYCFSILRSPSTEFDFLPSGRYRNVTPRLVLLASWEAWLALLESSARKGETTPGDLQNSLTIVCMPYSLKVPEEQLWRTVAEVQRPIAFRPSPETASRILGLLYTGRCSNVIYSLKGTPDELEALYNMIVADLWANRGGMSSTEQLFALACVQVSFRHWCDWDDHWGLDENSWIRTLRGGRNSSHTSREADNEGEAASMSDSESSDLGES